VFYDAKLRRKMNKLTLYIARYKPSTNISGHSAPCSNCLSKIQDIGIKKIVYVDGEGIIQKCLSKNYKTDYISVGYREYQRIGIKVI
jgi:deoxycytidylate deaminase